MATISKQKNYSQESTLLYEILKELNKITKIAGRRVVTTTTTTTTP